ncbi:MAG: cupin domain-containing protein [Deltaproteobacteria bacterium]|nr:cupin domain-containing protein [Deltaproteobacteria bacterium]
MAASQLIKNIEFATALDILGLVDYEEGRVVSRTLAQNPYLSVTLFAFAQGEGISAHTVPADALVQVLDGEASLNIGGNRIQAQAGQVVAMPQGVPHALTADKPFKMLLTVVKSPQPGLE